MIASLVVSLQGAPEQALRCFEALADLPDLPEHEVIVVDDAAVGLDELLARLGGDVEIARSARRVGLAGSAGLALERARGEVVVLLRGAPAVQPDFLAPLVAPLRDAAVAATASVTAGLTATHPVATHALAARADDLRAPGVLPSGVSDDLVFAALCTHLAGHGRVEAVAASAVRAPGNRTGGARRAPGERIELSVVIPTLDAASERVRGCLAALQAGTDVAHEIVVLDNGAPPQGFTAPVNAGLRAASGDYVVVMNDDVEVEPGWWAPLRAALDAGASIVFPTTVEGTMRTDFAAWCFALRAEDLVTFGHGPGEFFDPGLCVWYQDTDLLVRLRAEGRPPRWVPESRIRHGLSETVASEDPALRSWILEQVARDRAAFEAKHGMAVEPAGARS